MPPKRERSHSPSSNHDIEKRLCVADPPSAQVLNAGASQTAVLVSNNHLGSVSVCDSSDDERQPGAVATAHDPWDLEFVEIDDDDDDDDDDNGDTRDSEGGDCAVEQASGSATDGASGEPLLGLHKQLKPHMSTSKINTLLGGAVGDCYVKLTDIPDGADWNFQNYLSAVDGRALVLVAFGSLCFVHLQFGRMMLPSFSVSVELLRDSEKDALQNILDLAENRHEEATRHLRTFRAAHDEHSTFYAWFKRAAINVDSSSSEASEDDKSGPAKKRNRVEAEETHKAKFEMFRASRVVRGHRGDTDNVVIKTEKP
ncbi:hypothetical protein GSI_08442 [Ganoderma sinense ZZ0214-1]|uniref:Uncharacterized protein n=1 Tax=Ganoderma sinense ZZ0214-1 TaxID=1077348 RepID=A0A2G8S4C0_9APHY|nr:hypothetical protein GSI_08442 [Ganoderma sinense ZZ0214-1]